MNKSALRTKAEQGNATESPTYVTVDWKLPKLLIDTVEKISSQSGLMSDIYISCILSNAIKSNTVN